MSMYGIAARPQPLSNIGYAEHRMLKREQAEDRLRAPRQQLRLRVMLAMEEAGPLRARRRHCRPLTTASP